MFALMAYRHPTYAEQAPHDVPISDEELPTASATFTDWTMAEEEGELRRKVVRDMMRDGVDHTSSNFEQEMSDRMVAATDILTSNTFPLWENLGTVPYHVQGGDTKFNIWPEARGYDYMGMLRRIPVSKIKGLLALAADGKLPEDREGALRTCEIFMFARWLKANIFLRSGSGDSKGRTVGCFRSTPLPEYSGVGSSSSSNSGRRKTVRPKDPPPPREEGPCEGGCDKDNCTTKGPNPHGKNYRCFTCGHSWFEKHGSTRPVYEPHMCPHAITDHRGSSTAWR